MVLTAENIANMGFSAGSIRTDDSLEFVAALEWLNNNTDFGIDTDDPEDDVQALPAGAKLFIVRYIGMVNGGALSGSAVSSESIGGMSKSYGTTTDRANLLRLLAKELLGSHYLMGKVSVIQDYSRWS